MRRIRETLTEIQAFLRQADQSSSPLFRELAAEYAAACREAAHDLERCREFFEAGTPLEAFKFNSSLVPPLTERCRALRFSGREQWTGLCRSYGAELPPELDDAVIRKLESDQELFKAVGIDELLKLWRGIARTGSDEDKMRVLRQLTAAASSNRQWRENLLVIEKNWIDRKLREAAAAFQCGDGEKLCEIHAACTAKELLAPARESDFQPYSELMSQYRRRQFDERETRLLAALNDAYSMMDHARLERLLADWDELSRSPLFHADELKTKEVGDIRNFLAGHRRTEEQHRQFEELKSLFSQQLADETDFSELERTYTRMQQSDLPIPAVLQEQFANREQRYGAENRRRHVRACFFGALAVIFLAGSGFFLYHQLAIHREIDRIAEGWSDLLQKDPATVLKSADELMAAKPHIAGAAKLTALRAKAEEQLKVRERESRILADKLARAAQMPADDPERIERVELAGLLDYVAKHSSWATPDELKQAGELRDRINESFIRRCAELDSRCEALSLELSGRTDPALVEKNLKQLKDHAEALRLEGVDPQFAERRQLLLVHLQQLQKELAQMFDRKRLAQRLYHPEDLQSYFRDLLFAEKTAPALWSEFGPLATAQTGTYSIITQVKEQLLENKALSADLLKPEHAAVMPFLEDWLAMLPAADGFCTDARSCAQNAARECANHNVLTLPAGNGQLYCVMRDKAQLERAGGALLGGALKSLSFRLNLPQNKQETVLFSIARTVEGQYMMRPEHGKRLYDLPDVELGPLSYEMLLKFDGDDKLPSPAVEFWRRLDSELADVHTMEQFDNCLLRNMRTVAGSAMVPPLRKQLLRQLLELFGSGSKLNFDLTIHLYQVLHCQTDFDWLTPRIIDETQSRIAEDEFAAFSDALPRAAATKELFRHQAARQLEPAGILYREAGKLRLLLWYAPPDQPLLIAANRKVLCIDPALNGQKLDQLPPELRDHTFNGQLIYRLTMPEQPQALLKAALIRPKMLQWTTGFRPHDK